MPQFLGVNAFLDSQVGPLALADGATSQKFRIGRTGEQIVAAAHGKYFEAVSRGNCFVACSQAVVTWGTSLTATAVTFTLYNPANSGKVLSLLQCGITMVTGGTAGSIVYAANVNTNAAAPATNTALTVNNAYLGGPAGVGVAYSVTTLPAAPVAVRTAALVLTAAGVGSIVDYVDGALQLRPNTAVTIQGITVVGTGLVSMLWEEIAV